MQLIEAALGKTRQTCQVLLMIAALKAAAVAGDTVDIVTAKLADIEWLAAQPNVVNAVLNHNAKELTQDLIKYRDLEWVSSNRLTPLKQEVIYGKLGSFLRGMIGTGDVYSEFIVTDKRGVNVGCYPETSDYWQGDEQKWVAAFNQGKGAKYIGKTEFDQSTQSRSIQVAVPIYDKEQVIGVLIAGIHMNYIEYKRAQRQLNAKPNDG